jgi:hypothetical protein
LVTAGTAKEFRAEATEFWCRLAAAQFRSLRRGLARAATHRRAAVDGEKRLRLTGFFPTRPSRSISISASKWSEDSGASLASRSRRPKRLRLQLSQKHRPQNRTHSRRKIREPSAPALAHCPAGGIVACLLRVMGGGPTKGHRASAVPPAPERRGQGGKIRACTASGGYANF